VIEKKLEKLQSKKQDFRVTPAELKALKEKAKKDAMAKGVEGGSAPLAPKLKRIPVSPGPLNGNDGALKP